MSRSHLPALSPRPRCPSSVRGQKIPMRCTRPHRHSARMPMGKSVTARPSRQLSTKPAAQLIKGWYSCQRQLSINTHCLCVARCTCPRYGTTRPNFLLANNTPGFQAGVGVRVMCASQRPSGGGRINGRAPFSPPGTRRQMMQSQMPTRARFIQPRATSI
jgi:hypothetical protein